MQNENAGQWAIVELMGHKVVAGQVAKDEMLGKPMLRVDVPATDNCPAFTQFYGETAIYCVTFVSEEVARRTAEATRVNPVSVYVPELVTIHEVRGLPAPRPDDDDDDDNEDEEWGRRRLPRSTRVWWRARRPGGIAWVKQAQHILKGAATARPKDKAGEGEGE